VIDEGAVLRDLNAELSKQVSAKRAANGFGTRC
jgi:hypothetical protein